MTDYNSFDNDDGFIGVGTPWFKPHGSDRVFYWGNPVTLTLDISTEKKKRVSRCKEDNGASKDTNSRPNPTSGTFATDSFTPKTWALMMLGETAYKDVAAQTIVAEPVKAVIDGYADLANEDLQETNFEVLNAGTPLSIADYELNPSMGYLRIRESAGVTEGTDLTVNYQTEAVRYLEIEPNAVSAFNGEFGMDGVNTVNDRKFKFYAPNASMAPNGTFSWISEDYNAIEAEIDFSKGRAGQKYLKPTRIRYYD